jgi:Winged helix-turn-helix DNA-binding
MRERVRVLFDEGLTQKEIAVRLGVSKGTVAFHMRRLDIAPDPKFARRFDWSEIRVAYEAGLSLRQCMKRFGFSSHAWYDAIRRGAIVPRPVPRPIEELLVAGRRTSRAHIKRRLLKEGLKENRCEKCGITEWMGRPLSMQLHHKNGDGRDNRIENIEFLCGNCHSQTDTYGGRNGHRKPGSQLRLVQGGQEEEAA